MSDTKICKVFETFVTCANKAQGTLNVADTASPFTKPFEVTSPAITVGEAEITSKYRELLKYILSYHRLCNYPI